MIKKLTVIQGGKAEDEEVIEPKLAGSGPKGPDWLRELGYGAQFVCHPKTQVNPVFLLKFAIAFVLDECLILAEDIGGPIPKIHYVNSKNFSNYYKLVAVLPNSPEEAENKDGDNPPRSTNGKDNDGHERVR